MQLSIGVGVHCYPTPFSPNEANVATRLVTVLDLRRRVSPMPDLPSSDPCPVPLESLLLVRGNVPLGSRNVARVGQRRFLSERSMERILSARRFRELTIGSA